MFFLVFLMKVGYMKRLLQIAFMMSALCFSRDMSFDRSSQQSINTVVFDYGGVLAKISMTQTAKFLAGEFQVTEEEVKNVFSNQYITHRMKLFTDEDFWSLISVSLRRDIPEGINERYKQQIYDMVRLLEDKKEIIKDLKRKGYKVCLLSNQYPYLNDILKEQKVFEEFDVSVISCDYGIKKPTEQLYEILLNKIDEDPAHCLFVDDTYENIEAAKKLGFCTLYYNVFKHPKEAFNDFFSQLPTLIDN